MQHFVQRILFLLMEQSNSSWDSIAVWFEIWLFVSRKKHEAKTPIKHQH